MVTHACLMNTEKAALQMYSNQQLPAFTQKVWKILVFADVHLVLLCIMLFLYFSHDSIHFYKFLKSDSIKHCHVWQHQKNKNKSKISKKERLLNNLWLFSLQNILGTLISAFPSILFGLWGRKSHRKWMMGQQFFFSSMMKILL